MNRDRYRLIFNRSFGMWIPVAEHQAARRKSGRRRTAAGVSATVLALLGTAPALAARSLPVPAASFVTNGSAAAPQVNGSTMTIRQTSSSAVRMQWQSFDIGAGNTVRFVQPSATSRAINVVLPGGPRSDIYGSLQANGQVFLFNQAGVLFGPGARVDVGGLVASSLKMNDELIDRGLSSLGSTGAAFAADGSAGDITVAAGARILAAQGGRILLAAPNVTNAGELHNTEGQTILAAGQKVYLADPLDSRLRGFLVEVDMGGNVTNQAAAQLLSERGNITLVGDLVRHQGLARATTSVTLNGSIYLKARDTVGPRPADPMFADIPTLAPGQAPIPVGLRNGRVELAAGSRIEVTPETGAAQTVRDDTTFLRSQVNIYGRSITAEDASGGAAGASVVAPNGDVRLTARADSDISNPSVNPDPGARVYLGRGTRIDVSGLDNVAVAADHDMVQVELRGDELKDSPALRDPALGRALYGKKIWVDTRSGTQLADVSAYFGAVERSVAEKSTVGGSVSLSSQGDVIANAGSRIDVSGGSVAYAAGTVTRSLLTPVAGRRLFAEDASGDQPYVAVVDRQVGTVRRVEGRDAGSVSISAFGAALDGSITGTHTVGLDQRRATTRYAGPGTSEVLPGPRAGALSLQLLNAPGAAASQNARFVTSLVDRALSATGTLPDTVLLDARMFDAGGIGDFSLSGARSVSLPAGVTLRVAPSDRLDDNGKLAGSRLAVSAQNVSLDGSVQAPGARVAFSTSDIVGSALDAAPFGIRVGARASLSVAGQWQNDGADGQTGYLAFNGGQLALRAAGSIDVAPGARLDVSAGAWRNVSGDVKLGQAGRLELTVGQLLGAYLDLGGTLSGYGATQGLNVTDGGTLVIGAPRVRVVSGASSRDGTTLLLGTDLFGSGGFANFDIGGRSGIDVGGDGRAVAIQPQPLARVVSSDFAHSGGRADLSGAGPLTATDRSLRGATSVTLHADDLASGTITVGRAASITVDTGGRIGAIGEAGVDVAGTLRARGGAVTVGMTEAQYGDNFVGAQIHLAPTALLDATGAAVLRTVGGRIQGDVYDGGTVTLSARRGYLVAEAGARVIADGTRASLLLPNGAGGQMQLTPYASNGGSITLSAREGLYADAVLSAAAGGSGALGGSLSIGLNHGQQDWFNALGMPAPAFAALSGTRTVALYANGTGTSSRIPWGAPPDIVTYAGRADVGLNTFSRGGFDSLTLQAVGRAGSNGVLAVMDDLNLNVPGTLVLDSPNLTGLGGASADFSAARLVWQNAGNTTQGAPLPVSSVPGDGTLRLAARAVDVAGNVAASGFASTTVAADHDLRFSGAIYDVNPDPAVSDIQQRGSLVTAGDLTLRAAQFYPATGTDFAVEIQNTPDGVLRTERSGQSAPVPLSAGGHLRLAAPHIEHGGVARAPFGTLEFAAEDITRTNPDSGADHANAPHGTVHLLAGSVASTSADGAAIPYGQTQVSGREWVAGPSATPVTGTPEASVTLRGDTVQADSGARVVLSGGGDLQAWEWIPGVGGSQDILAGGGSRYAILPAAGLDALPFDPAVADIASLGAVKTVQLLGGGNGLAPGSYVLLPARYALLPGAYLVTLHPGSGDLPSGFAQAQPDGSLQVAAMLGEMHGGGPVSSGRTFMAEVLNADQVRMRAEYQITRASERFGTTRDAGRLALEVGRSLGFDAAVQAMAGGGRGLQVDLTATELAVLGQGGTAGAGEVGVGVDLLNGLGAQSLLLGAVRDGRDDAGARLLLTDATVFGATRVRVDNAAGPALAAGEVILAARERVDVGAGSRIEASGPAQPEALHVAGSGTDADGAMLRVANAEVAAPLRDAPARDQGTLTLGAGAALRGGNLVLDATHDTINDGAHLQMGASGGTLSLSGSRISVGDTAAVRDGLIFDNGQLAALGNPSRLTLKSYSSFDLYGDVSLGGASLSRLVIDAAGIGGYDNAGRTQHLAAGEVVLGNSAATALGDAAFSAAVPGSGVLRIDAGTLVLGDTPAASGTAAGMALRGFSSVDAVAGTQAVLAGKGDYAVDGALNLITPLVTGRTGADVTLGASGALALTGGAGVGATPAGPGETGAALSLRGDSVRLDTHISLPAGRLGAQATGTPVAGDAARGALTVGGNGWLEATGVTHDYLGATVDAPAGSVTLASAHGDVTLAPGARVDVSAAGAGDAGSVNLAAPQGALTVAPDTLRARTASAQARGGALGVDVQRLPGVDALAAVTADFTRDWELRVREGDTRLGAAAQVKAQTIGIAADAGSVTVDGTLDASGAKGGDITVSARRADGYGGAGEGAGDVVIGAGAQLRADATEYEAQAFGTRGEGGTVTLDASPRAAGGTPAAPQGGRIRIAAGAHIDVGTARDALGNPGAARAGQVVLQVERLGATGLGIDALPADVVRGARQVFIEGTRVYADSSLNLAAIDADNAAFMDAGNLAALRAALGLPTLPGDTAWTLRPAAEIRTSGDFTVSGDQNFNTRRYDGGTAAARLTVRAAGDLRINGTLSDGFNTPSATGLLQSGASGWDLALVGGADLAAADTHAVADVSVLPADKGSVILAPGKVVRTGAGAVDVAAGRGIRLGAGSAIYSAGVKDAETDPAFLFATRVSNRNAEYPDSGGDVSLRAGGSIVAAPATQLISQWLYRQGGVDGDGNIPVASSQTNLRNVTWYPRFDAFAQGVGTFGGGDVTVVAGGNIDNLGAVAATSGRLYGAPGSTPDLANLKVLGGGDVTMTAGGNIGSPVLYSGRGTVLADAGGSIGNARAGQPMDAVVALGEASATLRAAGDVAVQGVVTPTLMPQVNASGSDPTHGGRLSYFSTYGADSRVDVLSYGGSVRLDNSNPSGLGVSLFGAQPPLVPAGLSLVAMGGSVDVGSAMVLMPSTANTMLLAARDDVNVGATIKIPDVSADLVPNIVKPAVGDITDVRWQALGSAGTAGRLAHDDQLLAARVDQPVRIVAEDGNVTGPLPGSKLSVTLISPQQVWIDAGGDVKNFALRAQHVSADDVTRIAAGGDVTFSPALSGNSLLPQDEGIVVGGEGRLEVIAGGNVDLANSLGIVTNGNADNPYLPERGAAIFAAAGTPAIDYDAMVARLRPTAGMGSDAFDAQMLSSSGGASLDTLLAANPDLASLRNGERANVATALAALDAAVTAHMRALSGNPSLDTEAALAAFAALPAADRDAFYAARRPQVQALLAAGLRYAGRLGDRLGDDVAGYQPGLGLMATAFPRAQDGSINVFYSQIRSEQGGNVDLLAPGGDINVGVTGAGASSTPAARQGIFAIRQGTITAALAGDFQVGPSRVFTLGGGDIQIWSSHGNIDAGKGAKTAVATPPPQVRIRGDVVVLDISNSVAGSGIGTLGDIPANVRLYAPAGAVNAGDAGIRSSGNLEIGAQRIIGADNISVGGTLTSSAAPAPAAPPPAAPASAPVSDAVAAANDLLANNPPAAGPRGDSSLLTVEVLSMGDACDEGGKDGADKKDCQKSGGK